MTLSLAGIERHSSVNGPGVRYVIFTQGCPHHCLGCQNPETWNPAQGEKISVDELVADILASKYIDGVTFSGGDPLFQGKAILMLAKELKKHSIDIWCYTGWTWEQLLSEEAGKDSKEVLSYIDVLVDGPFQKENLSTQCIYRGSTNQRLIDCKKSLAENRVVLAESFDYGL